MAEQDRTDEGTPEGGIFGKLPDSRPGTRSPRRRSSSPAAKPKQSKTAKAASKRPSAARPKAASKPAAAPRRPPAARPAPAPKAEPTRPEPALPEPDGAPGEAEGGRGLEDLAWAGVAVAAEAATAGVRLASRALEALKGSQERR